MAAGDVVSALSATVGSWVFYQPAAGVEVLVTSVYNTMTISNGVIQAKHHDDAVAKVFKIFINNTIYLAYFTTATATGFTGIQIK